MPWRKCWPFGNPCHNGYKNTFQDPWIANAIEALLSLLGFLATNSLIHSSSHIVHRVFHRLARTLQQLFKSWERSAQPQHDTTWEVKKYESLWGWRQETNMTFKSTGVKSILILATRRLKFVGLTSLLTPVLSRVISDLRWGKWKSDELLNVGWWWNEMWIGFLTAQSDSAPDFNS